MMRQFCKDYLNVLRGTFQGLNLTAIEDDEEFFVKQVLDSIAPLEQSSVFKKELEEKKLMLDVGFGGGFPILPLAKMYPEIQFLGVEARQKKALAVQEIARQLNIPNVTVFHQRLEEIILDKKIVLTFKAVGKVVDCLSWVRATKEVSAFFYKGPNYFELEKNKVPSAWVKIEEKTLNVEKVDGRLFLGHKLKDIPYGIQKKEGSFIKLSDLVR